jgi:hypothetical protein
LRLKSDQEVPEKSLKHARDPTFKAHLLPIDVHGDVVIRVRKPSGKLAARAHELSI